MAISNHLVIIILYPYIYIYYIFIYLSIYLYISLLFVAEPVESKVVTPQSTESDLSPKHSNVDSDSDSTSTELCDEPDRLSDVDSEDLTSASESCTVGTDEEKSSRMDGSPIPEKTLLDPRPFLEERAEPINAMDSSKDSKICEDSLVDMSIAKITDQIRRLSAEDDNNSMVPQMFNDAQGKESPDEQSKELDAEKSTSDLSADIYTSDTATKKSSVLNDYDYSNFGGTAITSKQDDVHKSKRTMDEIVDTPRNEITTIEKDRIEDRIDTSVIEQDCSSVYSDYSTPLDTKYDKIPDKPSSLDLATIENEIKSDRFKTSYDFSSRISLELEPCKTSKTNSIIDDASEISANKTEKTNNTTLYGKTYVGHLPISPITVDQKLNRITPTKHEIRNIVGSILDQDEPATKTKLETPYIERSKHTAGSTSLETSLEKMISYDCIQSNQTKMYAVDLAKSPKTPESNKSFSSGETMGPDSKPSSLTVSPRTPVRSDSRDFSMDKSVCSSVSSSDSKTLVLRSVDSDGTKDSECKTEARRMYEMSSSTTPISMDSSRNNKSIEASPAKLIVSSSSESCSPSKLKSSERSFSSDLQSPISANSIKYTSNFARRGQDDVSGSPMDLSCATSPFYPISNPNQKTPTSPYSVSRRRSSLDSSETSPEQKSRDSSRESSKFLGSYQTKFDSSSLKLPSEILDKETVDDTASRKGESYARSAELSSARMHEDSATRLTDRRKDSVGDVKYYQTTATSTDYYRKEKDTYEDGGDDPLSEKDVVPSLPQEKALDKRYLNYRYRDRSKLLERSSSSLDSRRYADMKSSASADEFTTTIAKKRSSDILEDIKHLEAKANDGMSESGMLTRKSGYIWEDMKSLEARRQDTFSNSARNFSKHRLGIPDINVTGEGRKSYVVHPRINIDENSDSILKSVSCGNSNDTDDGRESKLGVWTKVKPRKKSENGRRNSDRALKIIQENSAILQKILACQAKKRLPDLEEISKEITISPINEEISKIFSPILEKMGLNEHEINEELARINFKDLDNMTATSVSEFDAKINEELSKLSLIDETEQMDHFDVDEAISHEYLDTREALIDRKINEELSKLLANYDDRSPTASMVTLDKGPSSQNTSEIEGLDLSSISTNVFSYKSSNDSIDARSDLPSTQEPSIPSSVVDKYSNKYTENVLPYTVSKYQVDDSSPKSDIDIYRELEKLDKISSAQVLPDPSLDLPPQKELSSIPYVPNKSPFADVPSLRYTSTKPVQYMDTSPLNTSYDPYNAFDYKPNLSPASNPFATTGSYEKPAVVETSAYEYVNHKPEISINAYDLHLKSPIMTKESLEFRVRYDDEPTTREVGADYASLQSSEMRSISTPNKSPYFSNGNTEPFTPTKYQVSKEERCLDATTAPSSFLHEYASESSDILRRKYDPLSPKEYSHAKSADYDRHLSGTLPSLDTADSSESYLPTRVHARDYHSLSPNRQFPDKHFSSTVNHYASKLSPSLLSDESKRPVSHPEFPGKMNVGKYPELPDRGPTGYKKSSLSLGNIGHSSKDENNYNNTMTSPKTQFSPFPVRNAPRKPKELTLKLGLYSPKGSDLGQLKRS